ncbi:MAG: MOSC domain-containing protein [Chloroflexi bacterium]|nr:MOSC domain-containing protein [Chloroflexota bacterium]
MAAKGKIVAVCVSAKKGVQKHDIGQAELRTEWGIVGDAHAGPWHRQVSLLAQESIDKMRTRGLNVHPGSFAENITTEGLELHTLPVGTRIRLGNVLTELTQVGKECHTRCAIYETAGDCVMPREGVFVRILADGQIAVGDVVEVLDPAS